MLYVVRAIGEEHLAVAQIAAEHADLVGGAKGGGEEPVGMQALQPLAIETIGFRSAGDTLGLAWIDQEHLHAPGLSQFKQGNPVDPGGFHGDGGDATVDEPVGHGVEVSGEGAETAHGLGVAPRGHGDPVLSLANVDARGMGVADLEGVGERG